MTIFVFYFCSAPHFDMSELESLFSTSAPNSDLGGIHSKAGRGLGAPKSDKVQLVIVWNFHIFG